MTNPTKSYSCFIGCDVGKSDIVVHDSGSGAIRTIANRPKELVAFMATLDEACLVICEATGGYEAALLDAAVQAGIAAPPSPISGPMRARSRRSFALSARWASPMPSMPARWPAMAPNARPIWPYGKRASRSACGCRPWC